jgi:hypothetical protein
MRASSMAGVFAFGILSDEQPVNSLGAYSTEGRLRPWECADGTYVGVEL